jgi:hypothetical protein
MALPGLEMKLPGRQNDHWTQGVAGLPSSSQNPSRQSLAGVAPPAQYWPLPHGLHTGAVVAVPGVVSTVPAGQSRDDRQTVWFAAVV